MGSVSDWETMKRAADCAGRTGRRLRTKVVSAHRTPKRLYEYAEGAKARGLKVIIAGAGGAAHLPGMTAALTTLPVLGVPVKPKALRDRTACCRSCRCRAACRSLRFHSMN